MTSKYEKLLKERPILMEVLARQMVRISSLEEAVRLQSENVERLVESRADGRFSRNS